MPSILKNDKPVSIVLEADKEDKKPATFFCKRLKFSESKALTVVLDELADHEKAVDMFQSLEDVLNETIVGWKNMGDHTFENSVVTDLLSFNEAIELAHLVLRSSQLSDEEKN